MFVDESIEDHRLSPRGAAQTCCIIHDDQAEILRGAGQERAKAVLDSEGGRELRDRGGVRAGHPAGLDETPEIPAPDLEVLDESLVALDQETDREGDPERFRGADL